MVRWLLKQVNLILTALAFATFVWAVATSEENPGREANFPEPIPIEIASGPGLVVSEKSAEEVRVRLRAPLTSWDQIQRTQLRARVEAIALGDGTHQLPVQVQVAYPRVTVVGVEPAAIQITLERSKSKVLQARGEVLDSAALGYTFRTPVLTPAQTTVSGPSSLVDRVSQVVTEIFLRGARASLEREMNLVARDAEDREVRGVSLSPATVLVRVPVEQRVGFKEVSIKTVLRGVVAPGYWVSNIVVNPSTVTMVGSAEALAKISGFVETAPIDINGATADVASRANAILPDGVSFLNNEPIDVRVAVTPILGGQTVRRNVIVQGLRAGLTATVSPDSVEVILSGPLANLANLSPEVASIIVDATGMGPGVYPVKPRVIGVSEPLRVQNLVPETIQLIITDPSNPSR